MRGIIGTPQRPQEQRVSALENAIVITTLAHEGAVDKAGAPYICIRCAG